MYDAVVLWLRGVDAQHVPGRLTDCREHIVNGLTLFTGKIGNVRVKVDGRDVRFEGSIPSYLGKEGYATATRLDAREFTASLSDRCGMPIDQATVSQLEIGATLALSHSARTYLSLLSTAPGLYRCEFNGNDGIEVLFRNGLRCVRLYNKGAQMGRPNPVDGIHWMRAEVRLEKRVKAALKRPAVLASDLCEQAFHHDAVELWRSTLLSIEHARPLVPIPDVPLNTWHDVANYHVAHSISIFGGPGAALGMLLQSPSAPEWDVRKVGGFRRHYQDLARDSHFTRVDNHITELHARINETAAAYLL